jgi:hypothetical protein
MDLNHQKPARKIAAPCRYCGREFFAGKRDGRRRQFCSNACRQAQFRNAEFARRYQVPDRYETPKIPQQTQWSAEAKIEVEPFPSTSSVAASAGQAPPSSTRSSAETSSPSSWAAR